MIRRIFTRLTQIAARIHGVLSINKRNLEYIYVYNRRRDYPVADNKLQTKEILQRCGVPVPETLATFSYFYELGNLEKLLAPYPDFVIKPARGSGGGGIVVVTGRDGDQWLGTGERRYSLEQLKKHIGDILFGIHSFGLNDQVLIERRVCQHPAIEQLCAGGLADIRIITLQQQPVICMLRVPTRVSGGRANLHQGALGIAVDLATGRTTHATLKGESISHHPDTGQALIGITIPYWREAVDIARRTAAAVPLRYLGVDVAMGVNGPLILEINVRPGLEIQNVNRRGMRYLLQSVEARL